MKIRNFLCIAVLWVLTQAGNFSLAQDVEVIDTAQLVRIINEKTPKTKVISFWATWCKPCVQELPYLEDVNVSGKAEVILVSVDFLEDIDEKVYKFIREHDLTSRICLLDNVNYNSWIDRVDKSWTGSIPATLVINTTNGKRKFLEKQIKEGELDDLIKEFNN